MDKIVRGRVMNEKKHGEQGERPEGGDCQPIRNAAAGSERGVFSKRHDRRE